jgi:hypothetical protein
MRLRNTITITSPFIGKSKFDFWKNLEVGQKIEISMPLTPPGNNRGTIYATTIFFKNKTTGAKFDASLTIASNYLGKIGYDCQED